MIIIKKSNLPWDNARTAHTYTMDGVPTTVKLRAGIATYDEFLDHLAECCEMADNTDEPIKIPTPRGVVVAMSKTIVIEMTPNEAIEIMKAH